MRGQIIIEFLIVIALAGFIGIMYLAVATDLLRDHSEEQRIEALNDVGYMIQDELILAAQVKDGYQRAITIPQKADRFPYTIGNSNNTLTLNSSTVKLIFDIPTVAGDFRQGANIISRQGGIVVNP